MDISMDIHAKSVDMDMDMDGKFHIHGNPESRRKLTHSVTWRIRRNVALLDPISFCSSRQVNISSSLHSDIEYHPPSRHQMWLEIPQEESTADDRLCTAAINLCLHGW